MKPIRADVTVKDESEGTFTMTYWNAAAASEDAAVAAFRREEEAWRAKYNSLNAPAVILSVVLS